MPLPNGSSINSDPVVEVEEVEEVEDREPLIETRAVPPKCCSARFNLATLMFLGFSMVYALRVNLSVAMVAMVNGTDTQPVLNGSLIHTCPLPPVANNTKDPSQHPEGIPQYHWDSQTQGWLQGAFFFGYLCTQILGGYLSGHYGGTVFLGLGVLCTAALTLLTPVAAQMGAHWLFALRALEGLGEGVSFPAMMAIWARWAPPLERTRLMTLSSCGSSFGAFVALPLTGYICQTLGWPAVFYICGTAGCLWSVLWFILVSDDPRTHRRISKEERLYIVNSIGPQGRGHGWSLPVMSMLLSVPLWSVILTQMCTNWSYYTLLTSLPTYMDNILHFDLKSNGLLSALPYFGGWIVSLLASVLADVMIARKVFSITVVRKLFTVAGLLPYSVLLVAVNYVGCNHVLTITFLTLSSSIGGISSAGVFVNLMDIAPRYSGILLGITNTFGTIPGIVAPIVAGYFTQDHSLEGWRTVFWLASAINLLGALIFSLCSSGNVQAWAVAEEEGEEDGGAERKTSRSIST